jgi:hypothetical protein
MLAHLRNAVRLLARTREFTVTVVLILALGIGVNTAVFTIVRAVLLRPLPYHEADRLVYVWGSAHTTADAHGILTGHHVADYAQRNTTFASHAVLKVWQGVHTPVDLRQGQQAERLRGALATPNFFDLLGVRAALGRTFLPSDNDGEPVVVMSDALWRRSFGADPGVIGSGVAQASLTTAVPMRGVDFLYVIGPKGGRSRAGNMRSVDPDYFSLMRIPLRAGRVFDAGDRADAPPVMVVSESYGRRHFANLSPRDTRSESSRWLR